MPEQSNSFELRSEEIQEIIGLVPNWIVRWGITVLFSILILFVLNSYWIKYPDVTQANALITTNIQPKKVTWMVTPPLEYKVMVADSQMVNVGDTLFIENNVQTKEVFYETTSVAGRVIILRATDNNPRKSTIIVTPSISNYQVQLSLPIKGVGQVKIGQKVQIKLDPYPVNEFGYLEGKITSVVPYAIDNNYRASVKLSNGMNTTTGKKIPVQYYIIGTAEVMLDDKNLLSRFTGGNF
jgi:HlyD family secretion protein